MTGPRLTPERRRMLKLLARSRHGVNEEMLVHGHGVRQQTLVGIVRHGLAATERDVVKAGGKTVEVVSIKITEAGRRAIEG